MALYLDYNASTPIDEDVLNLMIDVYKNEYGNADSRTHIYGTEAKKIVEQARARVSELLQVKKNEVIFTSGSTESNNLAILGMKEYGLKVNKKHIVTTSIEHKSVLEPIKKMKEMGFDVDIVRPQRNGRIDVQSVMDRVREDTLLVSIMHVNNETGTIQPVEELGNCLEKKDVYFHVDASQSCGKLVEELQRMRYDLLSISGHKMYGPQGVGALILRVKDGKKIPLNPIMYGGGQENGLRSGTLPVPLIAGFGLASEKALRGFRENCKRYKENQKKLLQLIDESHVKYDINGDIDFSVGNTLNISFEGIDSEAFMLKNQHTVSVSNGSACTSSYTYKPSYVLQAMGLDEERIEEAIRISWGREKLNFDEFIEILDWIYREQS